MELSEIITQKIREKGPICFQDYMEMCLYYPDLGYYTSTPNRIGNDGDFYTSPCLTPVFGAMIGKQLEEMWHNLGETEFTIVEYGAGTGALCRDILAYLRNNAQMYKQLSYCIIEKSPAMRNIEKEHLHEKVYWYDSIAEIKGINGCILSNELVDNLAVHQVVKEKELMEITVDYQNEFIEVLQPARAELKQYLSALAVELPIGFRTEINLEAIKWIEDVAAALNRGYVMTIDYGYSSSELYKACRSRGTLMCYHQHAINELAYHHIGHQDITSHVNFSALSYWGAKHNLMECGFTDQCNFLLALGFKDYLNRTMSNEKDIPAAARKVATISHLLLIDMGSKFKILIQEKGTCKKELSGLSFSCSSLTF